MSLTELFLKNNHKKNRDKVEEYADRDGMSVRISQKGKIVFQYRYRFAGKAVRMDLGSYPEMSLKSARNKLIEMRAILQTGKNPKIEQMIQKQKHQDVLLLSDLFEDWYQSYCVPNKKSAKEILASFNLHILPELGRYPVDSISVRVWLDILEKIAKKTPSIAERILVNSKQMLKWAKKRELIEHNVLSEIFAKSDLNIQKNKKDRVLDDDEIKMLFIALYESRISYRNRLFVELCLMFGCRNGELRKSKKTDFDFDKKIWTVPVKINKVGKKTGRKIIRPILPEMEELLREAMSLNKTDYLFVSGTEPISHSVPLSLPYNLMQYLRSKYKYEMKHWSMHDLRRTARTNFSSFTSPNIAEIMLGHSLPGEQSTYDYYDYIPEQTEAYAKWLKKLAEIKNQAL